MSKFARSIIALLLFFSFLTLPGCMSTFATSISQTSTPEPDATKPSDNTTSNSASSLNKTPVNMHDILSNYHHQAAFISNNASQTDSTDIKREMKDLREETVSALRDAGFEAYNVTKSNFSTVEALLNTDLTEIGLSPENNYIITVSVEDKKMVRSSDEGRTDDALNGIIGSYFTYTSGDTTYMMRYVTVTAADVPEYGSAESINLLNYTESNTFADLLSIVVSACVENIFDPFPIGTVASLCGAAFDALEQDRAASTFTMTASCCWTREFTQVFEPTYASWVYGSCVEQASLKFKFEAQYYVPLPTNDYVTVVTDSGEELYYSDKYFDYTWRKEQAIYGLRNWIQWDTTGDISVNLDGNAVYTFVENF